MGMFCSSCKAPMLVIEYERIEIDHCISCGAIWLDSGELEMLLKKGDTNAKTKSLFERAEHIKEKRLRCPKCMAKMDKAWFNPEKSVIIDICRSGHGIWLDRGELESILGSSETGDRINVLLAGIFAKKESKFKGERE